MKESCPTPHFLTENFSISEHTRLSSFYKSLIRIFDMIQYLIIVQFKGWNAELKVFFIIWIINQCLFSISFNLTFIHRIILAPNVHILIIISAFGWLIREIWISNWHHWYNRCWNKICYRMLYLLYFLPEDLFLPK